MRPTTMEITDTDYLQRARDIAPTLVTAADEIDRRRELPEAIRTALIEGGFYRLLLPRSLGGAELLPAPYVRIIEEIAKADASTAWCLNQTSGCSMTVAYLEPDAAHEIFAEDDPPLIAGAGAGCEFNEGHCRNSGRDGCEFRLGARECDPVFSGGPEVGIKSEC